MFFGNPLSNRSYERFKVMSNEERRDRILLIKAAVIAAAVVLTVLVLVTLSGAASAQQVTPISFSGMHLLSTSPSGISTYDTEYEVVGRDVRPGDWADAMRSIEQQLVNPLDHKPDMRIVGVVSLSQCSAGKICGRVEAYKFR